MPTEIDRRIVGLGFDNAQFEAGIAKSLGTIAKLKDALEFKGAEKGMNMIQQTASNMTFGAISKGLDEVGAKFDIWEQIAIGALRRVGAMAVTEGKKIIQNLGLKQMQVGWGKYGDITQSVQTMMSALPDKSIDEITERVEALRWFTDETSYSLSDMTSNIAKFTSAGVDLDTAVDAMMGIATASAAAGVQTQMASHAMQGFSKAMGRGYMMSNDWMWIQTSGLANNLEFKKILLDAATVKKIDKNGDEVAATLKKEWDKVDKEWKYYAKDGRKWVEVTAENIQASFSTKWLNAATMTEGLNKYGKFARKLQSFYVDVGNGANYTTAELLEFLDAYKKTGVNFKVDGVGIEEIARETGVSVKDLTDRFKDLAVESNLSVNAFTNAMEAISLKQAIDSMNDALSSQWSKTFESLIGNYEEQRVLWTKFANWLNDIFVTSAYERNDRLEEWHKSEVGGYEDLVQSFYNLMDAGTALRDILKTIFDDFIPPATVDTLTNFTSKFLSFTDRVKSSLETAKEYLDIFRGDDELPNPSDNYEGGMKTLSAIDTVLTPRTKSDDFMGGMRSLVEALSPEESEQKKIVHRWQQIYDVLTGIRSVFRVIKTTATEAWTTIKNLFGGPLSVLSEDILNLFGAIGRRVTKILDDLFGDNAISDFFSTFATKADGPIKTITGLIHTLLEALTSLIDPDVSFEGQGALAEIWGFVKEFATQIWEIVKGALPVLESAWNLIVDILGGLWEVVKNFFSGLNFETGTIKATKIVDLISSIFTLFVTGKLLNLEELYKKFKETYDKKGLFGVIWDALIGKDDRAEGDEGKGKKKFGFLSDLVDGFKGFTDKIFGMVNKYTNISAVKELAGSILKIAIALIVLAMIPEDKLGQAISILLLTVGSIAGILGEIKALKFNKTDSAAIAGLAALFGALSTAILALAAGIFVLSFRDTNSLIAGAGALIGAMVVLIIMLGNLMDSIDAEHVSGKKILAVGVALAAIGIAMDFVALAIAGLSFIDPIALFKGWFAMIGGLAAIVIALGVLTSMDAGGKRILAAGAAILAVAAALDLIALAFAGLSFIDPGKLTLSALILVSSFALIAMTLGGLSDVVNPVSIIASALALLVLSPALVILAGALIALSLVPFWSLVGALTILSLGLAAVVAAATFVAPVVPALFALAASLVAIGVGALAAGAGVLLAGAGIAIAVIGIAAAIAIAVDAISRLFGGVGGAFDWVKEKISSFWDWLPGRSREGAEETDRALSETIQHYESAGEDTGEGWSLGFNNSALQGVDSAELMNQISAVLGEDASVLGLTAEDIGNMFGSQLENGMLSYDFSNVLDQIKNAIVNKTGATGKAAETAGIVIGKSIEGGAKTILKVKSPSRVFMEIMDFVARGIEIGADRNLAYISDIGEGMGSALINSTESALEPLNDYNYSVSPSVTPVLDLSNVSASNNLSFGATLTPNAVRSLATVSADIREQRNSMNDYINNAVNSAINGMKDQLTFVVPLEVDGRQFAKSTARFTRDETSTLDRNTMRKGGLI